MDDDKSRTIRTPDMKIVNEEFDESQRIIGEVTSFDMNITTEAILGSRPTVIPVKTEDGRTVGGVTELTTDIEGNVNIKAKIMDGILPNDGLHGLGRSLENRLFFDEMTAERYDALRAKVGSEDRALRTDLEQSFVDRATMKFATSPDPIHVRVTNLMSRYGPSIVGINPTGEDAFIHDQIRVFFEETAAKLIGLMPVDTDLSQLMNRLQDSCQHAHVQARWSRERNCPDSDFVKEDPNVG